VVLLETTFDVDVVEDLHHLRPLALERPDLQATRGTLESLGLLQQNLQQADGDDLLAGAERSRAEHVRDQATTIRREEYPGV
jgi:hypothetical protein